MTAARRDLSTPRPWKVAHGSITVIASEDGTTEVCEIDCSYESAVAALSAHADADLIVQAVNEREWLLDVAHAADCLIKSEDVRLGDADQIRLSNLMSDARRPL